MNGRKRLRMAAVAAGSAVALVALGVGPAAASGPARGLAAAQPLAKHAGVAHGKPVGYAQMKHTVNVYELDFLNARVGFADAFPIANQQTKNSRYLLLKTTDGGSAWSVVATLPVGVIGLDFVTPQVGYIRGVPVKGITPVYATVDGGKTWSAVGEMHATTDDFVQSTFHFQNRETAFAGPVYTTDGGRLWLQPKGPRNQIGGLGMVNRDVGFALADVKDHDVVEKTVDGGRRWQDVFRLPVALDSPYPDQGQSAVVIAQTEQSAWVIIYGGVGMNQESYTVIHTVNGGRTWVPVIRQATAGGGPAPGYGNVVAHSGGNFAGPGSEPGQFVPVNAQVAYMWGSTPPAGADGVVYVGKTSDGGHTWRNLAASWPGTDAAMSFVSPVRGWIATFVWNQPSVLYRTTDGGLHWQREHVFIYDTAIAPVHQPATRIVMDMAPGAGGLLFTFSVLPLPTGWHVARLTWLPVKPHGARVSDSIEQAIHNGEAGLDDAAGFSLSGDGSTLSFEYAKSMVGDVGDVLVTLANDNGGQKTVRLNGVHLK
jgi:photosystem II stability/assembly factor-like uncharacterized protein